METGNLTELYYARVTAIDPGGRAATKITDRFSSLQHTSIKPPDVTCIPKVRSIQVIVHPIYTPIRAGNGHQLTLEDIFQDLFYRLELHINHTYQMHLEGKQREFEFFGLTPDTEFLGTIMIFVPTWSKESAPYLCRVKTLPDRTWTYSFSGAFLFSMGFLVAGLCYLSYRYITKPPLPPSSLNVQHVLTFQPLRFIQEHILIPVFDLSGPSGLAQPVQSSRVKVSGPREPPGALRRHSLSEIVYLGQPDLSIFQPSAGPPHQTLPPLSYAPQAAPEGRPPSYAPQVTPKTKSSFYAPQAISEVQLPSYTPQATPDSWPPSYGMCGESSGRDTPPMTLSGPEHLRTKGQLQKEAPAGSCSPDGLSLQKVTSLAMEDPQEVKSFHQHLGVHTDGTLDSDGICRGEPRTRSCLKGQLPLLSSVQIEGHPVSLALQTPSLPCSPTDEGPSPWGLLESLVCPDDESPAFETEAKNPGPRAPDLESPVELDSLFRGLALTVQWES
ncbi:interleukin-22 receptor subunit alpha-1 isoform X2 [Hippopotamus amphibius kiboko]|nr:interleukin-22 receptor subunit alpha-1 isoform X2 [Hippopotamus amphibius kiboko]XP_057556046.1 interleukin-22 receptor subunit alpha-1 isoform X2 [Hippopotamus amphibius kiboko]XP_057556054.1 interleukin-22 receptor subunit alpha-1 isoform X2 [Hippopotamus amphibius kiboko]XP_057556062.1 interleukin-22 receptor subunit alpha-1 isoform X2 [Hippopotamus amphibius kiboko]